MDDEQLKLECYRTVSREMRDSGRVPSNEDLFSQAEKLFRFLKSRGEFSKATQHQTFHDIRSEPGEKLPENSNGVARVVSDKEAAERMGKTWVRPDDYKP